MTSIIKVDTIQNSSGTSALSIGADGSVTASSPINVTTPIILHAYSTTTYTAGSQILKWNKVLHDTASAYSTSTGQFTCPRDGYYEVSFHFLNRGASSVRVRMRQNEVDTYIANGEPSLSSILFNLPASSTEITTGASGIINATAGDTIDIYIDSLSSGDIYGNANAHNAFVVKFLG